MQISEINSKLNFYNFELEKLKSEIEKNKFDYSAISITEGNLRAIHNTIYDLDDLIYQNRESDNDQEITEMPF